LQLAEAGLDQALERVCVPVVAGAHDDLSLLGEIGHVRVAPKLHGVADKRRQRRRVGAVQLWKYASPKARRTD